ncbi:FtsX-like permease family protein [Streptomyces sp. NPDC048182]|uniref:FtsX-like permease family protein n=1 Tax=Streptomyces sp. NPDC048182 TaxID=3365507 RepID=UPI003717D57D
MLTLTLRTLRTRWTAFLGTFLALALGTGLLTMTGLALAATLDAPHRTPERFATAPVVVRGEDTLRVPTRIGVRTQPLAQPHAIPAPVITRLKTLGHVTADRTVPLPGGLVAHPWSTAAFAPYGITAGRPPRADDEAAVTGDRYHSGDRLRTPHGTLRVVAVLHGRPAEKAVFLTDARVARLSPAVRQLVVDAHPTAVRKALPDTPGVQVLTGDDRHRADPDPDRDREALTALNALFGTAGGVAAFVSVFVVASTFAFAVAQRRREFGLLRTAGATPGRVRRAVLAEALGVGVLASATGCALGGWGAPHLVAWTVRNDLAPAWFTLGGGHTWPYHLAFWTGLLVALAGATAASWRAGRTAPTQALREVSVDARAMTPGRWIAGTALLATATVTLGLALTGDPGELLHRKSYVSRPMLLITATALLAPVLLRPAIRLLPPLPGAVGMLVRENAAAGVRRTAALAAPVLVTVALAGSLFGATATLHGAEAAEARQRTTADLVVTPPDGAGFDRATLDRLREVPGAVVSPSATGSVYVLEDGVALIRSEAHTLDPAGTTRLPLTAGRAADLDDDSIIVNEEWAHHTVGDRVRVWLGDGAPRTLRIAAVMAAGTGGNGVYVTPANAPGAPVDRVDVALEQGADRDAVTAGLRAAGGQVTTTEQWLEAPGTDRTTRLGFLLVLGIALAYTGLSLVNTLLMATSDRVRDLTVLRLTGATRRQVLALVGAEALFVVGVGALLGLLVTLLNLAGLQGALGLLHAPAGLALPWGELGTVAGACALLAMPAAVIPARLAMR